MKTIFLCLDLWDIVEDGFDEESPRYRFNSAQKKQDMKKDAMALHLIHRGVSKKWSSFIRDATSSQMAWDHLSVEGSLYICTHTFVFNFDWVAI